jgi:crotonobetainyl-CoA:carnitine CoA-transferase CaiB-like acyl-CoA transferase
MKQMGNSSPRWSPHGLFTTKDEKYAVIACSTEKLWRQLRELMGDESLKIYDGDSPGRVVHRAEIEGKLEAWTRQFDLIDLLELCGKAGLAIGPIYSAEEIVADPHIQARGSIITVDDPQTGRPIRMASPAGRFSGFKGEVRTLGPEVGEHTDAVLSGLAGLSADEIADLRGRGVVA